ncbi:MAG: 50S ribosomal protein L32 [Nitrospirota bacterium]
MANPTHRHTRTRRDKRRANWKGQTPNLSLCPECNELKLSFKVCPHCGSYRSIKVLDVVEKEV